MESILPQTEYINYAANKQESELMIQGSSSCIVSDIGSGCNSERKGLGVNGSLDVGMPLESSSAQRVNYQLGDQFWHSGGRCGTKEQHTLFKFLPWNPSGALGECGG